MRSESNNPFFLINGGHATAVFRPPMNGADLAAWRQWLKRGAAAISLSVALAVCWAAGNVRPLEATAAMEQLAAKMERMTVIHPDLADVIVRLMSRPGYDCDQVACSAGLQARNGAARNRLAVLIATNAPEYAWLAVRAAKFAGADATATGSIR